MKEKIFHLLENGTVDDPRSEAHGTLETAELKNCP
jgi:hypothetical protein